MLTRALAVFALFAVVSPARADDTKDAESKVKEYLGTIKGAEFSATQPIWGGYGVQGNYTYTDAQADNGDPLQGMSKNQFNIAGYFENARLSARLRASPRPRRPVASDPSTAEPARAGRQP